jgi:integrase
MGKNGFTNTDVKRLTSKNTDPNEGKNTYALGDNLRLRTRRDGTSRYVYIYRAKIGPRRGKKTTLTFGSTKLDIEDARQWARDQNTLIAHGKDPYQEQKAQRQARHLAAIRSKTFGQLAQEYYDKRSSPEDKKPWSAGYARNMGYVLKKLQAMDIAKLPADKLVPGDFEKIINDYGQHAPTMAFRFRDFMFGAMIKGRKDGCYQGDNPADPERLDINIKHTSKQHHGWHYDELPRLWNLLCAAEMDCTHDGLWTTAQAAKAAGVDRAAVLNRIGRGLLPAKQANFGKTSTYLIDPADMEKAGLAIVNANAEPNFGEAHQVFPLLRLLLLTTVRFSEANEMQWDEIIEGRKVWIIPGHRTKSKRQHTVPLVDAALEILEKRRMRRDPKVPYVFAHGRALTGAGFHFGEPLSEGCVIKHLKRVSGDPEMTIHSFRRGGGSWAESQFIHQGGTLRAKYDTKFMRAVLGHAVSNGLDYIYRSDANFEKPCRILLNDWADHLIHGPSEPTEPAEIEPTESAELFDFATRRIIGA